MHLRVPLGIFIRLVHEHVDHCKQHRDFDEGIFFRCLCLQHLFRFGAWIIECIFHFSFRGKLDENLGTLQEKIQSAKSERICVSEVGFLERQWTKGVQFRFIVSLNNDKLYYGLFEI